MILDVLQKWPYIIIMAYTKFISSVSLKPLNSKNNLLIFLFFNWKLLKKLSLNGMKNIFFHYTIT